MQLSLEEIAEILTAINDIDYAKVEVSVGDVHILVDKREGAAPVESAVATTPPTQSEPASTSAARGEQQRASRANASAETAPAPKREKPNDAARWLDLESTGEVQIVRAPMVGHFYTAKEPGAEPFVTVGGEVAVGQTVGLVEVMKLFHTAVSEASGTVQAILVADGEPVEHGQPLVVIGVDAS
jgi:acetyl-CoA carboxylase biotin carboxyl carrier protein